MTSSKANFLIYNSLSAMGSQLKDQGGSIKPSLTGSILVTPHDIIVVAKYGIRVKTFLYFMMDLVTGPQNCPASILYPCAHTSNSQLAAGLNSIKHFTHPYPVLY